MRVQSNKASHVQYRQTDTVWKYSLTIRMVWQIVKTINFWSVYSLKIASHYGELNVLPERQGERFDTSYGFYRGLTNWYGLKTQPLDPYGLTDRKDIFRSIQSENCISLWGTGRVTWATGEQFDDPYDLYRF